MRGSCTRCGAVHARHPSGMCPSELALWKPRENLTVEEMGRRTAEAILSLLQPRCEVYRGFTIELNGWGAWQWFDAGDPNATYHVLDHPEACKDAIDDLLFDLEEEARMAREYLNQPVPGDR